MKLRPSVSVLMPCRNAGPFLAEAAASALQQPDCLELLVADGGSIDGSLQLDVTVQTAMVLFEDYHTILKQTSGLTRHWQTLVT